MNPVLSHCTCTMFSIEIMRRLVPVAAAARGAPKLVRPRTLSDHSAPAHEVIAAVPQSPWFVVRPPPPPSSPLRPQLRHAPPTLPSEQRTASLPLPIFEVCLPRSCSAAHPHAHQATCATCPRLGLHATPAPPHRQLAATMRPRALRRPATAHCAFKI